MALKSPHRDWRLDLINPIDVRAIGLDQLLTRLWIRVIHENRPLVQDLVNTIAGAGVWLDQKPENRTKAVGIAAGRKFFNQDPKILQFVMDNPTDRVTYGDLRMIRSEFDELMQLSVEAGTLKAPVPYEKYVDDSFAKAVKPTAIPL